MIHIFSFESIESHICISFTYCFV